MGHNVRAAALRPSPNRGLTRSSPAGGTRAVRCCLILLACFAQLLVPVQHRHTPGIASHSTVLSSAAASSGLSLTNFDPEKSGVRCAPASVHAGSQDGGVPVPCQHDDCPCCPPVHHAAGILPAVITHAAYTPLLAKTLAPPPALLGSFTRPTAFDGQPRAPPLPV
jgi:hypothetical protein